MDQEKQLETKKESKIKNKDKKKRIKIEISEPIMISIINIIGC